MSHDSRPHRLDTRVDDPLEEPPFLTREECQDLYTRLRKVATNVGTITANVSSQWTGHLRWARNEPVVATDGRETTLNVTRTAPLGSYEGVKLNQIDDASLRAAVAWMERLWHVYGGTPYGREEEEDTRPTPVLLDTPIWSETTFQQTPEQRNEVARMLVASARKAGMLSAGYLGVEAGSMSVSIPGGELLYGKLTIAQCSLTVRDPEGSGSGWAGASSYDWARFDPKQLGEIALDKCLRSRNPVAIEPGRYTVILEPQATFGLVREIAYTLHMGEGTSGPSAVWYDRSEKILVDPRLNPGGGRKDVNFAKFGQKILDDRITIRQEPTNPDTGILSFSQGGEAYRPQTWIEKGVLVKLGYSDDAAHQEYHENEGASNNLWSFTMGGGTTSVDEMIKTTERGLLVTRFFKIRGVVIPNPSLLVTGLTRDGLWLIERGAISKAVKNMRFTDSILSAFNQVDALGASVPIFNPGQPAVVPPVKIKEFSFTSLVDAV